eukprot:14501785-Ditylum_brightwellii.AAC.1
MIFNLKKHNPDGFLILKYIIFELSPHLGGKGSDAQERVDILKITSEETLYEFQSRFVQLLDTLNIIQAIPDTTNQINKFIGKNITHMQSQPDLNIKFVMSKHILQWNQFQKQIFEELIDSGIPADTMIRSTYVPATFPASTTAASTSLPSAQVSMAMEYSLKTQVIPGNIPKESSTQEKDI